MNGYKPTPIFILPSFPAHISLPLEAINFNDKPATEQSPVLSRNHLDTGSLLAAFFLPEWVAKAREMIKAHLRKVTDAHNGCVELDLRQPDRGARTVVGQDGSGKFLKFRLSEDDRATTTVCTVYVGVKFDDEGNAKMTPYDALFGYQEEPRRFYGMKKISLNEFSVWRKREVEVVPVSGMKLKDLPPEIFADIFTIVLESNEMTDLIPTLLLCRLVDRTWHANATKVFCKPLKLSYHKVSLFVNGPNKSFLLNLHTLVICGNGRGYDDRKRDFQAAFSNISPLEGCIRGLSKHEKHIVNLLTCAPTLRAVKLCTSASKYSLARVVGWRQLGATPQPQDSLVKAMIETLNKYETEMRSGRKSLPARKDRYYWTIPLLFCLSAPSRELLDAIGKVLCACVDLQKEIGKKETILSYVIFEGGETWPYAETLRWFQKEKEQLVNKWPIETTVELVGRNERGYVRQRWNLGNSWEEQAL